MQTEKQVKFFIDEKEREQFKLLCKTKGVSASSVMRYWVQTAVHNQEINVTAPPDGRGYYTPPARETSTIDEEKMTALLKRLNKVERIFNYINEQDIDFIKNEVIGDGFGTLRNRLGVVESKLQDMGGTIAWTKD